MFVVVACGYALAMAANDKPSPSTLVPPDRTDLREVLSFHFRASRRRDAILDEATSLRAAGKTREAEERLKQAEEIHIVIRTLEDNCRSPSALPRG
jgi:hypothetical protein